MNFGASNSLDEFSKGVELSFRD